ncbi:MAG: DUF2490 domain-containing protein [Myxococcota bacterium]
MRCLSHRRIWPFVVAAALVSFSPSFSAAQDAEFQIWNAIAATARVAPVEPTPMLWLDTHARRGNGGTVLIFRPAVGLAIADWLSVWAGYAWVPVFSDQSADPVHEHRAWQQVILKHTTSFRLSFQSRTRFEQRFSEAGDDVGFRLREFVRVSYQPTDSFPMGVVVWDELFIGLNDTDWGAPGGVDQNRIFVGPFLKLAPFARLEMGYLAAYIDRETDTLAHVLAINLFISGGPRSPAP